MKTRVKESEEQSRWLSLSIFPRKLPHILIGDNSAEMAHNGTFTGNRDDLDTYLNMPQGIVWHITMTNAAILSVETSLRDLRHRRFDTRTPVRIWSAEIQDDSDDGYFSVIIGAVIAVVILVIVSLLVVILRYMYQHKGTYHTNESKGTELAESADAALRGDPGLCDTMDEGKREYFI
ncbi:hypothetical protein P4O66_000808 [Electrophorus voltai]|uniref:Neurexin/syndecan/glycophorin C domain-containing protein n=1 Tax=Electrophorus voltai TaxID=2609070 RepID=A0AAD8ZGA0_9TELE|nr:hypothetical protein P4O66_000808 [Electrophorus voltai]